MFALGVRGLFALGALLGLYFAVNLALDGVGSEDAPHNHVEQDSHENRGDYGHAEVGEPLQHSQLDYFDFYHFKF